MAGRSHSVRFYQDVPGNPVFQVESTLYKLDPGAIARNSSFLRGLLDSPGPMGSRQISSDASPIVIQDSVQVAEFEIFIGIAYGRPPKITQWPAGQAANPLLLRLLELSRYFISQATRDLALNVIRSRAWYFPPVQRIVISFEYQTRLLFSIAFNDLVSEPLRNLTADDMDRLGFYMYSAIARLKEAVQEHRCILAAEEPQFDEENPHCPSCSDNERCANDWQQCWWNGIGRFFTNGRASLTWTDAVAQFRRLDFGNMNADCLAKMMELVKGDSESGVDGYAHIYDMIQGVEDELFGGIVESVLQEDDDI